MNIILVILAVLYLFNAIRVKNQLINEHLGTNGNIGNFLGTFICCICEGICWWYLINAIIKYY